MWSALFTNFSKYIKIKDIRPNISMLSINMRILNGLDDELGSTKVQEIKSIDWGFLNLFMNLSKLKKNSNMKLNV